jgi:tetrahydromethanopterin S-methyltransferase subunit C
MSLDMFFVYNIALFFQFSWLIICLLPSIIIIVTCAAWKSIDESCIIWRWTFVKYVLFTASKRDATIVKYSKIFFQEEC